MKPSENPLGSEPVSSLLRRFAIPSVIAMLVSALYNMVDQLFIGHSIGVLGNAATNVAFPLSMVCTSIGLLCGIGGAANFNLCMGRKDPEHAKSYVGNAISMLAILGVILCVAVQLFLRPMMLLFGATQMRPQTAVNMQDALPPADQAQPGAGKQRPQGPLLIKILPFSSRL